MKKPKKKLLIILILFMITPMLFGQDKPLILIVKPHTTILCNINPSDPLDVSIVNFDFARKIYDALAQPRYREVIDLRSRFDVVIELTKLIKNYQGDEFIEKALEVLPYNPNIFLFTSIDKQNGKILLRAEILDLSTKSVALAKCIIARNDFFNDELVDNQINIIIKDLVCDITGCKAFFGFISFEEYKKTLGGLKYGTGIGVVYNASNVITIENISKDLRTIPPHKDDIEYRGEEILPVNIPDNYLVRENSVDIDFGKRLSLDVVQISYMGIVNFAIRTTNINESGQTSHEDLHRKWYVTNDINDPDNPNSGTGYIYYSIKSKSRNFFESKSFSMPLFITYPVLYVGRKKELICKLHVGTNILLPSKIELESENGWYRFGEYDSQNISRIGIIKEVEWFGGMGIEGKLSNTSALGLQFSQVFSNYKGDFDIPLSFKQQKNITTSLRINLIKMF